MFSKDAEIFIQFPEESSQRILHPVEVRETTPEGITVAFTGEFPTPQAGNSVILYFEQKREFMQQPARIEVVFEEEGSTLANIKPVGEPTSAESRQVFRVSTALSNLSASFAGEAGRAILDVSTTGFAIQSDKRLRVGEFAEMSVDFDGETFAGRACVQSVTELNDGSFRYGMLVLNGRDSAGNLPKGLQKISMAIQRQQLKRLAGAG